MKEYKCIELFRYHLSENTRKKFIEPVTASDGCIEIPQFGTKHSLNVSTTAGIVIWEFAQRLLIP